MTSTPKQPRSFVDLADNDPYPYYDELRQSEPVHWDELMGAWVVTSFEGCRYVLQNEEHFRFPFLDMDAEAFLAVSGGPRDIKFLAGREHHLMHHWYLRMFSPGRVAEWRKTLIREVVEATFDGFIDAGTAELGAAVADRVPLRVLARVMGLPWSDDEWMERAAVLLGQVAEFFNHMFRTDPAVVAKAMAASNELNALLMPYVETRRDGSGSDLISMTWRDGPNILEDWSSSDVIAQIRTIFLGGSDTTAHAICNAAYRLLTDPELREEIVGDGEGVIARFVEETLRLNGTVHFRPRLANHAVDLQGTRIGKDEMVVTVLAAADRDPSKFACPADIDFTRSAPRDHLAFSFGPRTCVGAALARSELQEIVATLIQRTPDIRLRPHAEPPSFNGFLQRSFRPLHVEFTPRPRVTPGD